MWKTKMGRCIYESPSGYKVYQNLCYRWLTLGSSALQTVINRWRPQKPGLYYLSALTFMVKKYPGATCLLGLGGAGIPHMLPDVPLIAVDCSEEVIDIAKKYFKLEQLGHVTVVHDNAMNYVQTSPDLFSHVLVDLYNANHFPPECNNEPFFAACKRIMRPEGILAVNLANHKEQWAILQLIKKQFKCTLVIPIKKSANMVILASHTENKELFLKKTQQTKQLKRIIWVNGWGYVGDY